MTARVRQERQQSCPIDQACPNQQLPTHAAACQQVSAEPGPPPDLAVLFSAGPHLEAIGSVMFCTGRQPGLCGEVPDLTGLAQ